MFVYTDHALHTVAFSVQHSVVWNSDNTFTVSSSGVILHPQVLETMLEVTRGQDNKSKRSFSHRKSITVVDNLW